MYGLVLQTSKVRVRPESPDRRIEFHRNASRSARFRVLSAEDASANVLCARDQEAGTDHHHRGAGHDWGEELLHDVRRDEGDADLNERSDEDRAEEVAVPLSACPFTVTVVAARAGPDRVAGGVHLTRGVISRIHDGINDHLPNDGKEGEGGAHDRDEAGAEVVRRAADLCAEDLDNCEDAAADPSGPAQAS
jgi:hypothetical protein